MGLIAIVSLIFVMYVIVPYLILRLPLSTTNTSTKKPMLKVTQIKCQANACQCRTGPHKEDVCDKRNVCYRKSDCGLWRVDVSRLASRPIIHLPVQVKDKPKEEPFIEFEVSEPLVLFQQSPYNKKELKRLAKQRGQN